MVSQKPLPAQERPENKALVNRRTALAQVAALASVAGWPQQAQAVF